MSNLRLFFLVSITIILLTACGGKNSNNPENKKIFKYNESAGITSLDPAFANRNIENTQRNKFISNRN